jgi:hypothetical protein
MTHEKWFASGKSNVFRLSGNNVNGLQYIMIATGCPLSGKDFLSCGEAIFKGS